MRVLLVAASAAAGLAAGHLPEKDRTTAGYNDGYAVGYNAACTKAPISVDGEWSSSSYSAGYAAGVTDGALACAEK